MKWKVVLAAAVCLASIGASRAERAGRSLYTFSCLHYCKAPNYGHPVKYCCRAARVLLATVHSTGTTLTTTTHTRLETSVLTTASTRKTLTNVVATPVLANLLAASSLGPAARGDDVLAMHYTTTKPDQHLNVAPNYDVSKHRGKCPPLRNYCPRASPDEPHLSLCETDDDCSPTDKCCYDSCLHNDVCKTADVERRHRRSGETPYGGRASGTAGATEVLLRKDGEPVHALVNGENEAVAAVEGEVITIFPRDSASSRDSGARAAVPLKGKDHLVYVVVDEDGEVVMDASGNTLTLARYGEGPTMVIHDAGMRVVSGRHALAEGAFTGKVRRTLVPNLTMHSGGRYSFEASNRRGHGRSKGFGGTVLSGRGKDVTLRREAPLGVVNADGVTFVIEISKTAEESLQGVRSSIALVDTDKINTDVMVDGEGNLILNSNGRPTTVQDIVGTMSHETNFEKGLEIIVDGEGNSVTLLDANNNVVRLLDRLGNSVSVAPGDYNLKLSLYSREATVHQTEDGFSVITDGSGSVIKDNYGHPLLLVPYRERQKRSYLFFYNDYPEYEGSGSAEPSMEDLEDIDAEEMDSAFEEDSGMYGSGEKDSDSPSDSDMAQNEGYTGRLPHAEAVKQTLPLDECEGLGHDDNAEIMQGYDCKKDMEEGNFPQDPMTTVAPEDESGMLYYHGLKRSVDDLDHTEEPDEFDESGMGEEQHSHSGMEDSTGEPKRNSPRRRNVPPMMPIPMMKRSVSTETPVTTEPTMGEVTTEGPESSGCRKGTTCRDIESDDPIYRMRRYAYLRASRKERDANEGSGEADIPVTEEGVINTGHMEATESGDSMEG